MRPTRYAMRTVAPSLAGHDAAHRFTEGAGVTVAVIDSGVDCDATRSDIKGTVIAGARLRHG
jgi:hypothetical protein